MDSAGAEARAGNGDRTRDLRFTRAALCQLSYPGATISLRIPNAIGWGPEAPLGRGRHRAPRSVGVLIPTAHRVRAVRLAMASERYFCNF